MIAVHLLHGRDQGVPMMRALSALAAVILLAAGPAMADDMVLKFTTDSIGKALKNTGHPDYTVDKDEAGDPRLTLSGGDSGADNIRIYFFECNPKGLCEDIMLQGNYSTEKTVYASVINAWNSDNRWTRAYINSVKAPALEMDINATGGIGKSAIEVLLNTYFSAVSDFATHIGVKQ
jgi:hypothetical protein